MADKLQNPRAEDRTRIDINDDREVRYWSGKFGCTRHELRAAVRVVGTSAKNVGAHLGKARCN